MTDDKQKPAPFNAFICADGRCFYVPREQYRSLPVVSFPTEAVDQLLRDQRRDVGGDWIGSGVPMYRPPKIRRFCWLPSREQIQVYLEEE